MKKRKEKPKKKSKSPEKKNNQHNNEEDVARPIGTFKGFVIINKKDQSDENELKEVEYPFLQDWLIIQHNQNNNKSRFSNLFKEILENDKKIEKKEENIDNDIKDKNLIPNNLIEDDEEENKSKDKNEIININEKMENLNINNNIIINEDTNNINNINNNIITNDDANNINNNIINNDNINNINNNNIIENNIFKDSKNDENNIYNINDNNINDKNNQNINIINNNYSNINNNNNNSNNNIMNQNILFNYPPNINPNTNPNNINNPYAYFHFDNRQSDYSLGNSNSSFPSNTSTAPSSIDLKSSFINFIQNTSGGYYGQKNDSNNQNKEYYNFSNKNQFHEPSHKPLDKKFDLNIDIKRIIYLEDRRTTLMIKNIPNKFSRDLILKTLDQAFKGTYDLFVLPTDSSGNKNYGYSFINFISCYYIPYFYYLFNNKNWSGTNSKKICEITYSKIQGRNSLLSHYSNKIIYKNDKVKKVDKNTKFVIPNDYYNYFNSAFPNYKVEQFESYFITKLPFRY